MNQEREAVALAIFKCAFHAADVATADLIEARKRDFAPTWEHAQECADAVLALRSGGEGWRLVPVEPTPEMLAAVAYEFPRSASFVFGKLWAAMLAAAPSPSTHGEG